MPTDSAHHEAPTEGSALPDAGTPQAPDADTAVPTDVPAEAAVPDDAPEPAVETVPEPVVPEAEAAAEPAAEPAAEAASEQPSPAQPQAERGPARDAGPLRPQRRPPRPPGTPPLRSRGDGPAVPTPEHHHLPGWVRRAHAKARPELAELLGSLQGAPRAQFLAKLEALVATISSGKFSSAWQYPEVIAEGRALQDSQRAYLVEAAKASRQLDSLRRRASDRLRDAADLLAPDAAARLQRALRSATDEQSIAAVESEAMKALSTARSASNKRRDREIERTRARINRSLPRSALEAESPTETWQDVLRRFSEEQSASTGAGG